MRKSQQDISGWLFQIVSHSEGIETGVVIKPEIFQNPEKTEYYQKFEELYDKYHQKYKEDYLLLLEDYSLSAFKLMALLSGNEKDFEIWYNDMI